MDFDFSFLSGNESWEFDDSVWSPHAGDDERRMRHVVQDVGCLRYSTG